MSAEWVQLPTDTHEHAAGLAEYRLLASECIRDAIKCLNYASAYRPSVERLRDPRLRIDKYSVYKHLRSRFYAHRAQLEADIDLTNARPRRCGTSTCGGLRTCSTTTTPFISSCGGGGCEHLRRQVYVHPLDWLAVQV